jgi:hypothetical protein
MCEKKYTSFIEKEVPIVLVKESMKMVFVLRKGEKSQPNQIKGTPTPAPVLRMWVYLPERTILSARSVFLILFGKLGKFVGKGAQTTFFSSFVMPGPFAFEKSFSSYICFKCPPVEATKRR